MARKASWILFIVLAIVIGLYPGIYFIIDRKFGLLNSKSSELLVNIYWNIAFYTHIILGGLSLLIGWTQFSSGIRIKHLAFHRRIGKVYVIAVMLSSLAAMYIALFATGGLVTSLGFLLLGITWFSTTFAAYLSIRKKQIEQHQKWMTYSYAACFAAVTLRIWLPFLTMAFGNFITAYTIVAWLCWIPNIIVAAVITRRSIPQKLFSQ